LFHRKQTDAVALCIRDVGEESDVGHRRFRKHHRAAQGLHAIQHVVQRLVSRVEINNGAVVGRIEKRSFHDAYARGFFPVIRKNAHDIRPCDSLL